MKEGDSPRNFVVGYWELIPMESGAGLSAPHDISTVNIAE